MDPSLKKMLIHIAVISAFVSTGLLIFFQVYLPIKTNHGETLSVPNLKGMSLEEAGEFLTKRDLRWAIYDSSFVMDAPPLTVISQNPKYGSKVKENRRIYLSITPQNPPMVVFPDLKDVTLFSSKKILVSYGLKPAKIRYKSDLAANVVLETWANGKKINPGDTIPKGTLVNLVVGDGRGTTRFKVPQLVGLSLEEAEYAILGSGLMVGYLEYELDPEVELGSVFRTYPSFENGDIVRLGDKIDLWICGNKIKEDTLSTQEIDEY
jgi:eukaryotic-like serine/threonine-protein kinase